MFFASFGLVRFLILLQLSMISFFGFGAHIFYELQRLRNFCQFRSIFIFASLNFRCFLASGGLNIAIPISIEFMSISFLRVLGGFIFADSRRLQFFFEFRAVFVFCEYRLSNFFARFAVISIIFTSFGWAF